MEESTLKTLIIGWVALTALGCAGTYVYEEMQKKSEDKTETVVTEPVVPEIVAPAPAEEEVIPAEQPAAPAVEEAPSSTRSERRHYNEDDEYDHYGDDIDF